MEAAAGENPIEVRNRMVTVTVTRRMMNPAEKRENETVIQTERRVWGRAKGKTERRRTESETAIETQRKTEIGTERKTEVETVKENETEIKTEIDTETETEIETLMEIKTKIKT